MPTVAPTNAALIILVAVAVGTTPPRAQAAGVVQGKIAEIRIQGNVAISRDKILGKILSREGREINEEQVEADRQSLLKANWFSKVETWIDKDPKGRGLILTFVVSEMPLLTEVEFRGRNKIKLKDVEQAADLKKGARADQVKTALAVTRIRDLYREKGYDLAEVRLIEGGKPGDTKAIFEIFEGPKCQIGGISFTGNSFVSDATLKTKISSRVKILGFGGKYHQDDVEEDARKLREYYQGQGFFEVKVTPVVKQGPTVGDYRVEFVIWEGVQFRVRNLAFDGNKLVSTAKLRDGLVMHSGQPYSDTFKDADAKSLESKYGEIGCIDAQIDPERKYTDKPGVIDLVYHIDEGQPYLLGDLIIKGNERTRDKVLRREAEMAGLVPGEPLNMKRVELYKKRIMNLRYFNMSQEMDKQLVVKPVNRRAQPYGESTVADGVMVQTRLQDPAPEDVPARAPAGAPDVPLLEPPAPAAAPPAGGAGPGQPFGLGAPFDPAPDVRPRLPADVPVTPPPSELPPVIPVPAPAPGPPGPVPGRARSRTPPIGAGEPVDFPNMPGMNMTDVGPDRMEPFPNRAYADIVTQVDEAPTGRLMFGVGASSFRASPAT
jgi:outer membrane protein insertion porin family